MIRNIINRIDNINTKLGEKISNSSLIYDSNDIPIDKTQYYMEEYTDISYRNEPKNILSSETILYDGTTIPEITLNSTYLAVNGRGFNISKLYPYYAVTEGCKYLLNYDYSDYPSYRCNCQVFDLVNFNGGVKHEFGSTFTSHFEFIKYVKKKYGYAKTLYVAGDYSNLSGANGNIPMCSESVKVDKRHNREDIVFKCSDNKFYKISIPMLDIKSLMYAVAIQKDMVLNGITFNGRLTERNVNLSYSTLTYSEVISRFDNTSILSFSPTECKFYIESIYLFVLRKNSSKNSFEFYRIDNRNLIKESTFTIETNHEYEFEFRFINISELNKVLFFVNGIEFILFNYSNGKYIKWILEQYHDSIYYPHENDRTIINRLRPATNDNYRYTINDRYVLKVYKNDIYQLSICLLDGSTDSSVIEVN
jgi:hypothetical protein